MKMPGIQGDELDGGRFGGCGWQQQSRSET